MSYSISLRDENNETILLPEKHLVQGGTYAIGGTEEAWLNVTWNYSKHFYRVLGERGIRVIYGMTGEASIPLLEAGAAQLKDDEVPNTDYWASTEGNARKALLYLIALARLAPQGIWGGD